MWEDTVSAGKKTSEGVARQTDGMATCHAKSAVQGTLTVPCSWVVRHVWYLHGSKFSHKWLMFVACIRWWDKKTRWQTMVMRVSARVFVTQSYDLKWRYSGYWYNNPCNLPEWGRGREKWLEQKTFTSKRHNADRFTYTDKRWIRNAVTYEWDGGGCWESTAEILRELCRFTSL